jgi:GDP-4-dehydro-6-deoxy-D-mannose reductase
MKKYLITGVSGFIGSHLAEYLLEQGGFVYGLDKQISKPLEDIQKNFQFFPCDILDKERLASTIKSVQPDYVYHLAAQSLPRVSWDNPETTFQVNIFGTLYLLDAIREAELAPTIEIFCSSGEYALGQDDAPISEDHPLEPSSPYALSKITQDWLSVLYWKAYQMKIIRVRPFFIIGPRKFGDVSSDVARKIVAIERGLIRKLTVGNLNAIRDFLDVRDAVAAFYHVAENGIPGEVYNVCSGAGYRISDIVEKLKNLSTAHIDIETDSSLFRPLDEPVKIGNNYKLRTLGWKSSISVKDSLNHILESWRLQHDLQIS